VNGDGRPDVIVTNYISNTVSVLLGNPGAPGASFQTQATFATGTNPYSVVTADVNGDGKPDLVVANNGSSTVGVLLGNGNGTFQTQATFASGSKPISVATSDVNRDGKPDLIVANGSGNSVSVLLASGNGNFTGQVYTIVASLDTISGTAGIDQITLMQDPDNAHIDWTLNGSTAQMSITDPNGLTINGNGSNDVITLQYSPNNPLPATIHLNGTFTINGLQGSNPLANTTLEIGRSIVFISYSSSPLSLIQGYLKNGYNNGAWNGTPTASTGVISSTPAAANAAHTTAIGYADSADGLITGQPANTIELKYTLYGDTTLSGTVGFNDLTRMTQHRNQTTGETWDTGEFSYDGSINSADFTLMTRTYNTALGSQAQPAISSAATAAQAGTATPTGSSVSPVTKQPAVQVTPTPVPAHHTTMVKQHKKRQR
jgi:hypothetical protein